MLSPFALPKVDGVPSGRYRLLYGTSNEAFFGVHYVNGRSKAPVDGRTILRQYHAFGSAVRVEPWDVETGERCLAHARSVGDAEAATALEAWLAEQAKPTKTTEPTDPVEPQGDGLEALSLDELRARCEAAGIKPGNRKNAALIAMLRAAPVVDAALAARTPAEPKGEGEAGDA